jgi:two-component system, chemotaxis family, chemotaxis protein CheY
MARILVADDSIYIRALVRRVLEGAGHSVVAEAATGAEALEAFARVQPDLAVVDIVMPGMDGIEVVQTLRSIVPSSRLVVHSVYAHEEKVKEALRAGATRYLVKSSECDRLVAAVEEALAT